MDDIELSQVSLSTCMTERRKTNATSVIIGYESKSNFGNYGTGDDLIKMLAYIL